MLLSDIKNWQQRRDGECLVACAKQVLDYLGIFRGEDWLWQQLRSGEITPFPNLENLANPLGVTVTVARWGELEEFDPYLESGLPIIVAIETDDLTYWPYVNNHAVVVVGYNEQSVFINDPLQTEGSQAINREEFMIAWSYRDFQYGVIRLTE